MTYPSEWYVMALSVCKPDMQDGILLAERFGGPLHHWLTEGLHMGIPLLLDKHEAMAMRHPDIYPLVDTGVANVSRYLHSNRHWT